MQHHASNVVFLKMNFFVTHISSFFNIVARPNEPVRTGVTHCNRNNSNPLSFFENNQLNIMPSLIPFRGWGYKKSPPVREGLSNIYILYKRRGGFP